MVSQDSAGRNHQILIPFDKPVQVVVRSAFFVLTDSLGLPLSKVSATSIPVIVPTGAKPTTIKLTIAGGGN
jgi:hypothetical protein